MHQSKNQVSLRIRTVWSKSLLGAFWNTKDAKCLHADNPVSILYKSIAGPLQIYKECYLGMHLNRYTYVYFENHQSYVVVILHFSEAIMHLWKKKKKKKCMDNVVFYDPHYQGLILKIFLCEKEYFPICLYIYIYIFFVVVILFFVFVSVFIFCNLNKLCHSQKVHSTPMWKVSGEHWSQISEWLHSVRWGPLYYISLLHFISPDL